MNETMNINGRKYEVVKDHGVSENMKNHLPTLRRQLTLKGARGAMYLGQVFENVVRMTAARGMKTQTFVIG